GRAREGHPERWGDRSRPSAGRHRREAVRDDAQRARAQGWALWPADDVRGRWHRERDDHRAAVAAGLEPAARRALSLTTLDRRVAELAAESATTTLTLSGSRGTAPPPAPLR